MLKVSFFDKRVFRQFLEVVSVISVVASLAFLFIEIPKEFKLTVGATFLIVLLIVYVVLWFKSNNLEHIHTKIEGSDVTIKKGDIFKQPDFKVIPFKEYFDTQVDKKIISSQSLNGIFVTNHLDEPVADLDRHIEKYPFEDEDIIGENTDRSCGKKNRFKIGTICI